MRQCIAHNVLWGTLILAVLYSCLSAQSKKTQAQNLVDLIAQKHFEISALDLSGAEGVIEGRAPGVGGTSAESADRLSLAA